MERALPIPDPAPVINATLSAKSFNVVGSVPHSVSPILVSEPSMDYPQPLPQPALDQRLIAELAQTIAAGVSPQTQSGPADHGPRPRDPSVPPPSGPSGQTPVISVEDVHTLYNAEQAAILKYQADIMERDLRFRELERNSENIISHMKQQHLSELDLVQASSRCEMHDREQKIVNAATDQVVKHEEEVHNKTVREMQQNREELKEGVRR